MKRYIYNFNWLFLDKIIRIFGGLFIGIWIARYLGPENFGILSYAMAFIAFFSFLSTLGLNSIVVREIAKDENINDSVMGATFYLKLYGGILAFLLGSILIFTMKTDDVLLQMMVILLLVGYIFQSFDTIEYSFQAKVLSKYIVIAKNSAFLVSSLLKIYLILNEFDVIYFAIISLLEIFLSSVFMILIYLKLGFSIMTWKANHTVMKALLKDSWPLMLSTFFITIYMKIDQIMIESFLDMQSVGLYSVAVRLSEAWYFIPTIIVGTLMPYFVKLKDSNYELYIYRLKQVNTGMFWMSFIVGLIATFFGETIIILLFGEVYKDAFMALSLSIWAGIFVSIGLATSFWVISENLQIYRLIGTGIGVMLNIVANYFLIPEYGITGAAVATLITQGLGIWVIPLFFRPIRGFTVMSITSIIPLYLLKGKK
ncbi:MAG: flippase [Sulfuricurvum sp.]|nr:flippase [Sulfuricurvum sp.]